MQHKMRVTGFVMLFSLSAMAIAADKPSREALKGLDEQVQDIKQDVLAMSSELVQLEEKLIYPSSTQVSFFVSVPAGVPADFRLDAVEVSIDGKPATRHLYTQKELDALREGGVQRLYTGNVRGGEHTVEVTLLGKRGGKDDYRETASWRFTKEAGPRLVEIALAGPGAGDAPISFKDW